MTRSDSLDGKKIVERIRAGMNELAGVSGVIPSTAGTVSRLWAAGRRFTLEGQREEDRYGEQVRTDYGEVYACVLEWADVVQRKGQTELEKARDWQRVVRDILRGNDVPKVSQARRLDNLVAQLRGRLFFKVLAIHRRQATQTTDRHEVLKLLQRQRRIQLYAQVLDFAHRAPRLSCWDRYTLTGRPDSLGSE